MLARAKSAKMVGVWSDLEEIFTLPMLANILNVRLEELTDFARNRYPIPAGVALLASDLADLHGVKPQLFQQWERHQGVLIGSLASGWFGWSLNSTPGWLGNSRWIGNPADLIPCNPETVALARTKNWR